MKYRTIIEITSDEFDKDSAIFAAGEYLKGNLGYDVISMKCRTTAVRHYRFRAIGVMGIVLFTIISALFLKSIPLDGGRNVCSIDENIEKTVCEAR